jgi:hypothetical protein
MANTLGLYDPNFYAAEALVQLEKALGMAGRVYRGYEKNPQELGSVINIRRPTYFTAQAMPISSANTTDLNPDAVAMTLDQWYGVQFGLTDKELAYTQERIINEHIRPAASAVADQIDLSLNSLARKIPWYYVALNTGTATNQITDWPALQRRLFDNQVSLGDIHCEINGERQQYYLACDTFNRADAAGSAQTQQRGTLGNKFGFEIFANQNVQTQQAGGSFTVAGGSLTVNAAVTVGATSVVLAASTCSGSFVVGDIIQIGHTGTDGLSGAALTAARNFVVTANATAAANAVTVSVAPKFRATVASGTSAAFKVGSTAKYDNLAFNRNAFALAMAPLPETARRLGALVSSIVDPITGLALRVTMWYEGVDAKVYVRIDALWGMKVLDEDMAVRYIS